MERYAGFEPATPTLARLCASHCANTAYAACPAGYLTAVRYVRSSGGSLQ